MLERLRMVSRAWKHRLRKDPAQVALIRSVIQPGHTCLDIGSHKCAYTYWMHRCAGPAGSVTCFEPQPQYAALGRKLWSNHGSVVVEHIALSDHAGEQSLFVPPWGPSPGASLEQANVVSGAVEVKVRLMRLDNYVAARSLGTIDFIKCDVEGHELSVLRGATKTLERDRPAILLECEARFGGPARVEQVFALLTGLGYQGYCIRSTGPAPLAEFSLARDQVVGSDNYINDFFFQHPASPATLRHVA